MLIWNPGCFLLCHQREAHVTQVWPTWNPHPRSQWKQSVSSPWICSGATLSSPESLVKGIIRLFTPSWCGHGIICLDPQTESGGREGSVPPLRSGHNNSSFWNKYENVLRDYNYLPDYNLSIIFYILYKRTHDSSSNKTQWLKRLEDTFDTMMCTFILSM